MAYNGAGNQAPGTDHASVIRRSAPNPFGRLTKGARSDQFCRAGRPSIWIERGGNNVVKQYDRGRDGQPEEASRREHPQPVPVTLARSPSDPVGGIGDVARDKNQNSEPDRSDPPPRVGNQRRASVNSWFKASLLLN